MSQAGERYAFEKVNMSLIGGGIPRSIVGVTGPEGRHAAPETGRPRGRARIGSMKSQRKGYDDRGRGRVCLVTSNFPRWEGDATTPFVLHLAQDLIELGWEVEVLAPHAPGAARHEVLHGVPVWRFRYFWPEGQQSVCYQGGALINLRKRRSNWIKLPALIVFEWLALLRLIRRRRPNLINAHWILPQGFVAVTARALLRTPVVITVHGGDVFGLRGRILTRFKRFALRHAAAVTVNSSATEAAVCEIAPDLTSLRRIPMGVGPPPPCAATAAPEIRARYRQGTGPLLAFVGRLVEEKGLGDLIRAVADLQRTLPDLVLMVLGDGQDRPVFEALAARLGLAGRVHFLGWVETESIAAYLAAADIFVGPSKRAPDGWVEAQGLAFVEAMLAGLPVIATRSGGIPDAVRHEETGLLVGEARADEIARSVKRLIQDPELAVRLANAGHSMACREFTRAASAEAFSQLFDELS